MRLPAAPPKHWSPTAWLILPAILMSLAGCTGVGSGTGRIRSDGRMAPFVVTAKYDPDADYLPVPAGTTREDYYGKGPSILHGPGREWRIERPYTFKLVRQQGQKLEFRFRHRERIAHAFLGERLADGAFKPRNEGYSVLDEGEWKHVPMSACWFGPEAVLLLPDHDYTIVVWLPFVSLVPNKTTRLKVAMDTGCWLEFESAPFEAKLPYAPGDDDEPVSAKSRGKNTAAQSEASDRQS